MNTSQNLNKEKNKDIPNNPNNFNLFTINNYHNPYNYAYPQLPTPFKINPFQILNNPFISYMNSYLNFPPQIINQQKGNQDEEKPKININIKNKKKFKRKKMPEDNDIKAIDIKEPKEKIQDNNYNKKIDKLNDTINDSEKNSIYIFIEERKKNICIVFIRFLKKKIIMRLVVKIETVMEELKLIEIHGIISITQKYTIEHYENHIYFQQEIIRKKIRNKEATLNEIKGPKFQKYNFIESYLQNPTLNYNEILINLIHQYELTKISYTKDQFSKYKNELNKKYIYNKSINGRINDIKYMVKIYYYATCIIMIYKLINLKLSEYLKHIIQCKY